MRARSTRVSKAKQVSKALVQPGARPATRNGTAKNRSVEEVSTRALRNTKTRVNYADASDDEGSSANSSSGSEDDEDEDMDVAREVPSVGTSEDAATSGDNDDSSQVSDDFQDAPRARTGARASAVSGVATRLRRGAAGAKAAAAAAPMRRASSRVVAETARARIKAQADDLRPEDLSGTSSEEGEDADGGSGSGSGDASADGCAEDVQGDEGLAVAVITTITHGKKGSAKPDATAAAAPDAFAQFRRATRQAPQRAAAVPQPPPARGAKRRAPLSASEDESQDDDENDDPNSQDEVKDRRSLKKKATGGKPAAKKAKASGPAAKKGASMAAKKTSSAKPAPQSAGEVVGADGVKVDHRASTVADVEVIIDREGDRALCKLHGVSYRKLRWVAVAALQRNVQKGQMLIRFSDRARHGNPVENADEWRVIDRVVASRRAKVVKKGQFGQAVAHEYLVKWVGLDYQHATWESAEDLMSPEDEVHVKRLIALEAAKPKSQVNARTLFNLQAKMKASPAPVKAAPLLEAATAAAPPTPAAVQNDASIHKAKRTSGAFDVDVKSPVAVPTDAAGGSTDAAAGGTPRSQPQQPSSATAAGGGTAGATPGSQRRGAGVAEDELQSVSFQMPTFLNGRKLRDYQEKSVRWMVNNYAHHRNHRHEPINCILGDEMGLGKTAQSISTIEVLRRLGGVAGPFLIVAPLTTLGHWQREIQTWTDMNVIVYQGDSEDRAIIAEHEFYLARDRNQVKFDAMLVSYDMLLKDTRVLDQFHWKAAILDEAHKLKGFHSSTRAAVLSLDIDWKLLLTGTPIQNNMGELFAMMNLLNPEEYDSHESFYERFGGGGKQPSVQQIQDLQNALRPLLLRRMKEDVENLPEKEEIIIWVELTIEQRVYYKALYERQIGMLLGEGSAAKNLPGMRNLAMELRKLCCHPFLCNGMEEDMLARWQEAGQDMSQASLATLLEKASGKMTLLGKLLPKLKAEGHKVLIFSQFKIMLDVIEDYLVSRGYPTERIDGSTKTRCRQKAIDRFMKDEEEGFVFLLSTRAGGQGITLTSADTIIIYDSDWNPQNDLQAMARCHRIGQSKEVKVYRLVTNNSYEEKVFKVASLKYGLDEAILGFNAGTDPEADADRIADLLQNGAHCLVQEQTEAADAFAAEDIDQILNGRTEKRQIGTKAGNTFSTARFSVCDDAEGGPAADDGPQQGGRGGKKARAEMWAQMLPEAAEAHRQKMNEPLAKRRRAVVNYNLQELSRIPKEARADRDDNYVKDNDDSDADTEMADAKAEARAVSKTRKWSVPDAKVVIDHFVSLGGTDDCWERLQQQVADLLTSERTVAEVAELGHALRPILEAVIELSSEEKSSETAAEQDAAAPTAPTAAGQDAAAPNAPSAAGQDAQDKKVAANKLFMSRLEAKVKAMRFPDALSGLHSPNVLNYIARHASTLKADLEFCRRLQALVETHTAAAAKAQPMSSPQGGDAASDAEAVAAVMARAILPIVKSAASSPVTSPDEVIKAAVAAAQLARAAQVSNPLAASGSGGSRHLVPHVSTHKFNYRWWSRQQDDDLVIGAARHGYQGVNRTNYAAVQRLVRTIMADPQLSFIERVGKRDEGGDDAGAAAQAEPHGSAAVARVETASAEHVAGGAAGISCDEDEADGNWRDCGRFGYIPDSILQGQPDDVDLPAGADPTTLRVQHILWRGKAPAGQSEPVPVVVKFQGYKAPALAPPANPVTHSATALGQCKGFASALDAYERRLKIDKEARAAGRKAKEEAQAAERLAQDAARRLTRTELPNGVWVDKRLTQAQPGDVPLPTGIDMSGLEVVTVLAMRKTAAAVPDAPSVIKTELLVKFKGYHANLQCWVPSEAVPHSGPALNAHYAQQKREKAEEAATKEALAKAGNVAFDKACRLVRIKAAAAARLDERLKAQSAVRQAKEEQARELELEELRSTKQMLSKDEWRKLQYDVGRRLWHVVDAALRYAGLIAPEDQPLAKRSRKASGGSKPAAGAANAQSSARRLPLTLHASKPGATAAMTAATTQPSRAEGVEGASGMDDDDDFVAAKPKPSVPAPTPPVAVAPRSVRTSQAHFHEVVAAATAGIAAHATGSTAVEGTVAVSAAAGDVRKAGAPAMAGKPGEKKKQQSMLGFLSSRPTPPAATSKPVQPAAAQGTAICID